METKRFQDKTDEELIEMLRAGQSEIMDFLLEKYKNLVRKKANAMFLLGGDTDDLIQEGMIGLFKAIRDYDTKKGGKLFRLCQSVCKQADLFRSGSRCKKKARPVEFLCFSVRRRWRGCGRSAFWKRSDQSEQKS